MLIAVASESDKGLEALVSAHFGRCPYYTLVEVQDGQVKQVRWVENPFYNQHGAPGEAPNFINQQGADVIIAGGMGPRAIQFFQELGIKTVTGATGTVAEAVEDYLSGKLTGAAPCD